eukprot:570314-Prymnesium_polylepis.3
MSVTPPEICGASRGLFGWSGSRCRCVPVPQEASMGTSGVRCVGTSAGAVRNGTWCVWQRECGSQEHRAPKNGRESLWGPY